ncbi:Oidioi.mRNA.OKI2018_I69.chr2.g7594.t1.cds [Oikopleura dioica]|uniref:Oidioi.mRNA.OKI2018_I69.chr2.g7594.t1.cds n=1 Tax=Oikopleura dioica TaxID=34765 RepID=A0ABN7T905_OIKDI|nr:Oidioi.mRNA.OKI2018_I69.chr2.g7594.t1.cds [Oikopleura dioica]
MFFLDDFLELLEPLKNQFKQDIEQIGKLDQEANSFRRQMHEKADDLFKRCQIKDKQGVKNIQEDPEVKAMQKEYNAFASKAKSAHEKKCKMMTETISKVDRYVRRCDEDLDLFKNEIEAEQPGITYQLEQKATDNTPELQRKNSVLGSDYEYDEKQFKHTSTRKKTTSASRARRPSDKEALAAHLDSSAAPSILRQASVPERGRKNSATNVRLDRSHSVGAPPMKTIRLDPGIPTTSAMPHPTVEVGVDGVSRPARIKKLTPKGSQYRQNFSKSAQLDNGFRVPLTESYNSSAAQIVQLPSTSAMFVQNVATANAEIIADNANSSTSEISPFKTLQIHPGMIQNINKVQD